MVAEDITFLLATGLFGGGVGEEFSSFSMRVERVEAKEVLKVGPGVSFESGRVLTVRRAVVATLVRDTVERVLLATERIEAPDDFMVSPACLGALRCNVGGRTECMLADSSSTFVPPDRGP